MAQADEGTQVAEEAGDFLGHDVPKLKLAHAGRVDDVAAAGRRCKPFQFFQADIGRFSPG
jgi:hypothetical protein